MSDMQICTKLKIKNRQVLKIMKEFSFWMKG